MVGSLQVRTTEEYNIFISGIPFLQLVTPILAAIARRTLISLGRNRFIELETMKRANRNETPRSRRLRVTQLPEPEIDGLLV